MSRAGFILAVLLSFALGCQKTSDEPLTGDERPVSPAPAPVLSPVTDWVTIDGVAVRIHKAVVQPPVVEERAGSAGAKWRERELEGPALMVWVQVQNRTGTKTIPYNGFGRGEPHGSGPRLTDAFGRVYAVRDHESATRRLRDRAPPHTALVPGGKVVTDVLCFEPPHAAEDELTLTLSALAGGADEEYRFVLPAVAWKK
jgi:hypothetical protein